MKKFFNRFSSASSGSEDFDEKNQVNTTTYAASDSSNSAALVNGEKRGTTELIRDTGDILETLVVSVDDDKHTRNLPLLQYEYYAQIQRDYEHRNDFEGLRECQRAQLSDPHSNLSEAKIQSQIAIRRASKYSVFFLITTDILGPSNAPYAMMELGLVPGIILYVAFGVFAMIGGKLLNWVFCRLDSDNFPLRTFADLATRIIGPWSRFFVAGLQFIQMILNVGIIVLTTGQALAQCIKSTAEDPKLCFTVQVLVWALLGMVIGQIRSLKDFSHLANSAVWMNIAICIITMVGAATGGPNYEVAWTTSQIPKGPVQVYAVASNTLYDRIQGIDQMVFAWGGATIFCEVMGEMARPEEFSKGLLGADTLILVVYLFYGIFVFCYQGQFTYAVANQGINQYGLQLASNILNILSGMLAAVLYSNVGLKIFYQGFGVPDLNFPKLDTWKGAIWWAILVVVYWGVAFIIGAAIPQVASLSSLVGAVCILNFSYTLPGLFGFLLMMQDDAAVLDRYDPVTAEVTVYDTWKQGERWKRAIFTGSWKRQSLKWFCFIFFLCLNDAVGKIRSAKVVATAELEGHAIVSANHERMEPRLRRSYEASHFCHEIRFQNRLTIH